MIHTFSQTGDYSPAVARNRSRKIEEILRAAMKLAVKGGLDSLTLQSLAAEMHRSVGSVYRYFPSKEAVIRELQRLVSIHIELLAQDTDERIQEWASAASLTESDRALARIVGRVVNYERFSATSPAEFGLVTYYLSRTTDMLPEQDLKSVFDITRQNLQKLADRIDDAVRLNVLKEGDGRERALTIWASLQGAIQLQKIARRGVIWDNASDLSDTSIASLLAGWGANYETVIATMRDVRAQGLADPRRSVCELLQVQQDLDA